MSRERRGGEGVFVRAYHRLGPRYPESALAVALHLEHGIVIVGVAALALYVPMSLGTFLLVAGAAVAGQELYAILTLRHFRRSLEPLRRWIDGDRGPGAAVRAWEAAASLPFELLRLVWHRGYPLFANVGWALFATWALGLEAWAIPILLAGAGVLIAYGNGVPFFLMERVMQPVLDDLAGDLGEQVEARALSFPLSRRLLVALPAINVVTGVAVVGLIEGGHAGIGTFGLAIAASLGVSLTLSFAFSALLATSVVAPIRRLQQATERVGAGDLATRVPVSGSDEAGMLTRSFHQMVTGLEERERLRDAFGTFVDPALAERVAEEGTDLAGEDVEVSILFLDIRGFTTYAEQADAHEVVARLNDLYERVVPIILRHGGHANKFIGDGLLAVFGAPERHEDHADRAVAAALEIAAMVSERYRRELRVGIGVNSGRVVVGTIGGGGRLDFTVIGDPVNTAARVESATRQTDDDVLITEATRAMLNNGSDGWEERPPIPLKGKRAPVRLYAPARREAATAAGPASSGQGASLNQSEELQ
jgi:adenylate cyclase